MRLAVGTVGLTAAAVAIVVSILTMPWMSASGNAGPWALLAGYLSVGFAMLVAVFSALVMTGEGWAEPLGLLLSALAAALLGGALTAAPLALPLAGAIALIVAGGARAAPKSNAGTLGSAPRPARLRFASFQDDSLS